MKDLYNLEININEMVKRLNMLSILAGIRINFYSENTGWIRTTSVEKSKFCSIIKSCGFGLEACLDSNEENFQVVKKNGKPIICKCHLGLSEGIIPAYYNDTFVGCFMFGQILSELPSKEDWQQVNSKVKYWDISIDELHEAYFNLQRIEIEKFQALGDLLSMIAKNSYDMEVLNITQQSLVKTCEMYIADNHKSNISLKNVAEYVHLNASYLSMLFKKLKGITISDYIVNIRMEKAKQLLTSTNISISEVGKRVGYNDQFYFTKVFKKFVGETPTRYRKLYEKL
jgi:AraC-like DNA-binding protein